MRQDFRYLKHFQQIALRFPNGEEALLENLNRYLKVYNLDYDSVKYINVDLFIKQHKQWS